MNFKKDMDRWKSIRERTIKCNCGHAVTFDKKDKVICHWCGKWVYKNPQIEFKEKIKKYKEEL